MQKEYLSLLIEVIEMKELLHTDPELIRLSIPFSQEEMSKLESSLMENGCLEPIIIWNGVILDGHKRYKICVDENIEYEIEDMEFQNSIEAAIWICSKRVKQYSKRSAPYLSDGNRADLPVSE